jgi:predicted membrane protein (TIGR00267 family)
MGAATRITLRGTLRKMGDILARAKENLEDLIDLGDFWEIARRYAVTNSFDSILMLLGIVLGGYFGGIEDPSVLLKLIWAGAISIFFSGSLGTYISERAERELKVRELEKAVLMALDETVISEMERRKAILISLASGGVPSIIVMTLSIPFKICELGLMGIAFSYTLSILQALLLLFFMGFYLGSLSGGRKFSYAIFTLGAGLLLLVVMFWLGV